MEQKITINKGLIDKIERYRSAAIQRLRNIENRKIYEEADYEKLIEFALYDAFTSWEYGTVDND